MKVHNYIPRCGEIKRVTEEFSDTCGVYGSNAGDYSVELKVQVFERPEYTQRDAETVVDWLNGHDRPIVNMVPLERDRFMERVRNHPNPVRRV